MLMLMFAFSLVLLMILHSFFFFFSSKGEWDKLSKSVFECGFTSYFFSRYSFSIHYFLIALTFLILDLELCFLMPFFNASSYNFKSLTFFFMFSSILTLGLIYEWKEGLIEWKH